MSRSLIFLPEAELDVNDAYWWYEEKDQGLGDDFLRSLEQAYSRITTHPQQFPLRFDDVRRILIRRFPYAVYFYYDEFNVYVTYVFHTAQDPDKLQGRI